MLPSDWEGIAKRIERNYKEHDGFIVIQGTDTLAYTASALSFMLENLAKPVIVTGSQLPLNTELTDAKLNYGHALKIAGYKATDLPRIPEVIVVFADKVLRGCRTRKMSASAWTGFDSPNCPPLGEIGEHVRIFESQIRPAPPSGLEFQLNAVLNPDVLDISLFPGLRAEHLEKILGLPNVKGVVLRTYGTGNAPEDTAFLSALENGIKTNDKVVVNITQCPQGMVEMGLYAASVGLIDNGVISGLDMTPEAALTKLMVTMGTRVGEQVKLQMQISQRGEQAQNLFDFNFKKSHLYSEGPYSELIVPDRRFDPTALSTAVLRMMGGTINVTLGDTEWIQGLRARALEAFNALPKGSRDRLYDDHTKFLSFVEDPANAAKLVELGVRRPRAGVDVFMNLPSATVDTMRNLDDHPRLICRIERTGKFNEVLTLPKEKMKNVIGDSDIVLTFVPDKGVSFGFEKASLSMFTRA